jgi:hypothetical protein
MVVISPKRDYRTRCVRLSFVGRFAHGKGFRTIEITAEFLFVGMSVASPHARLFQAI